MVSVVGARVCISLECIYHPTLVSQYEHTPGRYIHAAADWRKVAQKNKKVKIIASSKKNKLTIKNEKFSHIFQILKFFLDSATSPFVVKIHFISLIFQLV